MEAKHKKIGKDTITREPFQDPKAEQFELFNDRILREGDYYLHQLALHKPSQKYVTLQRYFRDEIKEFHKEDRMKEEEKILQVRSPFKVKFLGKYQDLKGPVFIVNYLPGESLQKLIDKHGGLPESMCKFYFAQIVLLLETLHDKGIIHRDLKAEHIILSEFDHYISVNNFDFATFLDKNGQSDGLCCGTPEYACPAKFRDERYGISCDIWALGVLLYVMFHNQFPFVERTAEAMAHTKHLPYSSSMPSLAKELFRYMCRETKSGKEFTIQNVKEHPWLESINWEALAKKQVSRPTITSMVKKDNPLNTQDSSDSFPWSDWLQKK